MAYELKSGNGTLFKNDKYEKGDNQPYCRGKLKDPTGKEWEAALWIPKSDKVKGFNITLKEPYQNNNNEHPYISGSPHPEEPSDDLPF